MANNVNRSSKSWPSVPWPSIAWNVPAYRLVNYERGAVNATGVVTTPATTGLAQQTWNLTAANNWKQTKTTVAGPGRRGGTLSRPPESIYSLAATGSPAQSTGAMV
jgi:hypothetical protein